MDADVPRIPEKPVMVAKSSKDFERRFNELLKPHPSAGGLEVSYGPIGSMSLGPGWRDEGVEVVGGRPAWRNYRRDNPRCTVQVNFRPDNHHKDNSAFLRNLTQTTGPVPRSEWNKIPLFGAASNPRSFTIESVEVAELGGKKVVLMTGVLKRTGTRAKNVYVSLSGDWKDSYNFAFAGPADKALFDKYLAEFDKALKAVVWKPEQLKSP